VRLPLFAGNAIVLPDGAMDIDPRPFDLPGDQKRGVLCIHGFTGTPFEMRHLGLRLQQRGMTALGPRLPGHAAEPADLDRTTWRDWYSAVETTFASLEERCQEVAVVGQSLGGLLALELATRVGARMSALAVLATPLWMGALGRMVGAASRRFPKFPEMFPVLPKLGGTSDVRARDARRDNPSYPVLPTSGVVSLFELMNRVRSRLGQVRVPTLVLHGGQDHTAPPACAPYLVDQISSEVVRLRTLPRSFHLISMDIDRDVVAAEVGTFFDKQWSAK